MTYWKQYYINVMNIILLTLVLCTSIAVIGVAHGMDYEPWEFVPVPDQSTQTTTP